MLDDPVVVPPFTGGLRGADTSAACSGTTQPQRGWRDEPPKGGIGGKAGQRSRLTRLERLAARRWLHADGQSDKVPSTIDDPAILPELEDALVAMGYGKK